MEGNTNTKSSGGDTSTASSQQPEEKQNEWMPKSGNGPYCTIPFDSKVDCALLRRRGLSSFLTLRDDARVFAMHVIGSATELVSTFERQLRELSLCFDENSSRCADLRLELDLGKAFMMRLSWSGVVYRNGSKIEKSPKPWDGKCDISPFLASARPEVAALMERTEDSAATLRQRWFAIVRLVHYLNVVEEMLSQDDFTELAFC